MNAALTVLADARETEPASMRRERIRWRQYRALLGGILVLEAVDAVWLSLSDLQLSPWPALIRLGVPLALLFGAACYGLSGRSERICATLLAFGTLQLFTFFGVILNYLAIRGGWPFADDMLASWDRVLGLDWLAYRAWLIGHPWFGYLSGILYDTSVIQIFLVVLILGFSGRFAALAEFTAVLMISAFVTVAVNALLPALGPYHYYAVPDHGVAYIAEIVAAHGGALRVLDLGAAAGLIVFPSFHTAISVVVGIACWQVRWLRYPALVGNGILLAGVPVWGSHYFIDVIAGAFVAMLAVLTWRRLFRKREASPVHGGAATTARRPWIPEPDSPRQA